ncbi:CoA pyrophosphatase [Vibrio mangrovi]|uniref:CoA pyrophosphatase n=1 Tax=Vibrio mangrovi TaxID=474394 RepID=A0A1Y6IN46_9VIBR|nr:CoA pyrophosphatase [Vibrio mangrovi]MDW6004119.1 CoA pyrophosphatase [Vibrio mangrovi]SMR99084.1 putative NUDIX hydrolase [Vibrio mangrovi]
MHLTRMTVLRNFQLRQPGDYSAESLQRVAHIPDHNLRKAAVLVAFVERPSGLNVIFTKRAAQLKHHPGQVSFPGGKCERGDASVYETAIREAWEEIGLAHRHVELIGCLPELKTISYFSITPVLAFVSPDYQVTIEPGEVDEVFEVPADYLLHPRNLHHDTFVLKNARHKVFAIPYQRHFIWGATAQIVHALQKQIHTGNL